MKKLLFAFLPFLPFAAGSASAATVLTENFTYVDGELTVVSAGAWNVHSGTGAADVVGGTASITSSDGQDVNSLLTPAGTFFNTGTLTATASVNFSALPLAAGAYFLHFKDTATGFRGRVWATTTGAAVGSFRLGISNTTAVFAAIPTDLTLGSSYQITLTLDVASGGSTLAIAGIGSVAATDAATFLPTSAVALRQNAGMGTLTVDNLVVDATAVAVPEASTAMLGLMAGLGLITRRRR